MVNPWELVATTVYLQLTDFLENQDPSGQIRILKTGSLFHKEYKVLYIRTARGAVRGIYCTKEEVDLSHLSLGKSQTALLFGTLLLFGLDVWLINESRHQNSAVDSEFLAFHWALDRSGGGLSLPPTGMGLKYKGLEPYKFNKTRALGPQEPQ